jgi:hypothetical protein
MSAEFSVKMMDLCTKTFFEASGATGLEIRKAKNGRLAFVCPAPSEKGNLCWKWASAEQASLFSGVPTEAPTTAA